MAPYNIPFDNGTEYVGFIEVLVKKINEKAEGTLLNMDDAFDYMTQSKRNLAYYLAMKTFNQEFHDKVSIPCKNKTINKQFAAAKEAAFTKFDQTALGDQNLCNQLKERLETQVNAQLQAKIKKNENVWLAINVGSVVLTAPLLAVPSVFGAVAGGVAALGIPVLEGAVAVNTLNAVRVATVAVPLVSAVATPITAKVMSKPDEQKEETYEGFVVLDEK